MRTKKVQVAPSVMSADLTKIGEEVRRCQRAGADLIHIDIMDGHFVPNLTFGPSIIAAINRSSDIFLEVHAMMYNPFDFIEEFVASGADRIIIPFEATEEIEEVLAYIRTCGVQAGVAFSPDTSLDFVSKFFGRVDVILMMSVQPGFAGQRFIDETFNRVFLVKRMMLDAEKKGIGSCLIEVDGGVSDIVASKCIESGADILVSASYLFDNDQPMEQKIALLRGLE